MNVYLVRHTSVDVPRGICYGQSDVPLKATFPQEALAVKEKLQHLIYKGVLPDSLQDGKDTFPDSCMQGNVAVEDLSGIKIPVLQFDAVYTSPLSRCTRLAEYCGYGDAQREPRILELDFGEWEMQEYKEIKDPHIEVWFEDWINVRATGGESFRDQFERVSEFLGELKGKGLGNVLLFCHGGVLACAKVLSGKINPTDAFSTLDDYGSILHISL